ncbi:hypothetical protein F5Y09DRAFT_22234 [Xylaria sp. FL1042]|nr:hypothetical protein F5Y09DRAFT_22234 [Xylaria sp. FL1042]
MDGLYISVLILLSLSYCNSSRGSGAPTFTRHIVLYWWIRFRKALVLLLQLQVSHVLRWLGRCRNITTFIRRSWKRVAFYGFGSMERHIRMCSCFHVTGKWDDMEAKTKRTASAWE